MQFLNNRLFAAGFGAVAAAAMASTAAAQLVVATGSRQDPSHLVDLSTMTLDTSYPVPIHVAQSTPLPNTTNASVWAMTADDPNQNLYYIDVGFTGPGDTNLFRYNYVTQTPQLMGVVREQTTGFGISLQGLALNQNNGKFYGVYNVGGTPGRGIYELTIPTGPGTIWANLVMDFTNFAPNAEWDMRSLEWDPATGLLHGINDRNSAVGGRGLYQFDLVNQTITAVQDSPTYRRQNERFDGVAFDEEGRSYWTTRDPGVVYIWDPATGEWSDFLSPVLQSGIFGGAAWAPGLIAHTPEPATLSLLVGMGVLALRRRGR